MKMTITIEDKPNGGVKVEMNPTGLEVAMQIKSGAPSTSAQGLALAALNAILREKKNFDKMGKGIIDLNLA